jgi:hypothetical protein
MRYAVLIVLGLAIGIIGTVMAMNALNSGPHLPESVMALQGFHMHALDTNVKQNHCAVTDNLPHVQALRMLSNDIEPAFLPIENEQDFRQKASNLRASIDAVLAAPPADCATVRAAMTRISLDCKGCHDEFRH